MKLHIEEAVKDLITTRYPQANTLLLALNDGSNAFSSAEGCCLIGDRFMVVVTQQVPANFTIPLANPDFTVYSSPYEAHFVKGELTLSLHPSTHSLMLKGGEGILDLNVELKEVL